METLEKAMNTMKCGGFINYYGESRCAVLAVSSQAHKYQGCKDSELLLSQPT